MGEGLTRRRLVARGAGALAGAWALGTRSASAAAPSTPYAVPGLRAPGEILVDRWGIPHIYATSEPDVVFLQGFNAARDRLWQIDLWRRRGLGRLAAAFGSDYVEQDRAARLFLYRGDMAAEWAAYGADAQAHRDRLHGGHQRLRRARRARHRAAARRVRGARLRARAMGARGHGAHPQPRAHPERLERAGARARAPRVRARGGGAAPAPAARLADRGARRARPRRHARGRARRLRPRGRPGRLRRRRRRRRRRARGGAGDRARTRAAGRRLEQLDDLRPAHHERAAHPRQRPAPRAGRAVAALHRAPRRPRPERHRRRQAVAARHLDRPQRPHRLRADDLRHRRRGPLRLRHAARRPHGLPLQGRLGGDAHRARDDRRARRRPRGGDAALHAPWPGGQGGPARPDGVRGALDLVRAGHGGLLPVHQLHAGARLARLPRRHAPLGLAEREPGLRRHAPPHRLEARRPHARAPELGRPAARAGRRPLRVGRLPRSGPPARRLRSRQGLVRDGERAQPAQGLPLPPAQARLRVGPAVPELAHRRGAAP